MIFKELDGETRETWRSKVVMAGRLFPWKKNDNLSRVIAEIVRAQVLGIAKPPTAEIARNCQISWYKADRIIAKLRTYGLDIFPQAAPDAVIAARRLMTPDVIRAGKFEGWKKWMPELDKHGFDDPHRIVGQAWTYCGSSRPEVFGDNQVRRWVYQTWSK